MLDLEVRTPSTGGAASITAVVAGTERRNVFAERERGVSRRERNLCLHPPSRADWLSKCSASDLVATSGRFGGSWSS
jgi:hypothetical protein